MKQYIIFESNGEKMAINISYIERIIEYIEPKKIPEASDYLLGVIQYNSEVIPIIDLTLRLYDIRTEKDLKTKTIIVTWKGKLIGFVVDDILGIEDFDEEDFEKSKDEFHVLKEYIDGFIKSKEDNEDITIVLNIDEIFDAEQEKELLSAAGDNK